jgi:hypothetical protein
MTLNHKIPSHLRALYMHLLEILNFHYTRTQLWNQAHNRGWLIPFQHRLILSQKCRREARRVFHEEEDKAWAARVSEYTMKGNLFALLQAENESITCKSYM